MAEGDGLIKGGGNITGHSQIRSSKVRRYQRRVDLRGIMKMYLECPEPVRPNYLCRQAAVAMHKKLKACPPFVGTSALHSLKSVNNEEQFEAAMDKVWLHAEARRVLLIA